MAPQRVGTPGGFFLVSGERFEPNSSVVLAVNSIQLGEVSADDNGKFTVQLDSAAAEEGAYVVTAGFSSIRLRVSATAELLPQQSGVTTLALGPGDGYGFSQALPMTMR